MFPDNLGSTLNVSLFDQLQNQEGHSSHTLNELATLLHLKCCFEDCDHFCNYLQSVAVFSVTLVHNNGDKTVVDGIIDSWQPCFYIGI